MRAKDAKKIRSGILKAKLRIICMANMGISMPDEVTSDLAGLAFDRTMKTFKPALESYDIYVGRADRFSRGKVKQTFVELVDMRESLPAHGRGPSLDDLRRELKRLAESA